MPPKIIQLAKKDDIAEAIRAVKGASEREIVLELEKGSKLFSSSDNLKLIKKTGEVLGKKVKVSTSDEKGKILARKVGMLIEDYDDSKVKTQPRVARSDVKPRFSDILVKKSPRVVPAPAKKPTVKFNPITTVASALPKFSVMEKKSSRSSSFSKYFIFGLVVLVVAVFALAVLLPQVTITLAARSEPINRDFEITVDRNISVVDKDKLQIPGMLATKEVSETKNFPATGSGRDGVKASGSVVIHNQTANTLTLKAATTTLTANGKKYSFTKDATGIKGNNAANSPIAIVADEAGAESNLPVNTRLEIVNAALGSTNQVFATSATEIAGGSASQTTVISQTDIDKATEVLLSDAVRQAEADITTDNSAKMILADNGSTKEVLAKTANKDIGTATDTFDMTLIARVSGLAMRQDDIVSVVVNKINQVLSSDKYLLDTNQNLTIHFKTVDLAAGKGVLAVHFETVAAYQVDSSNLTRILAGKNEAEIKEILLSKPEVDDVKVEFWPSWLVHKAPRLNGKIYINTILSQ